ncbi:MAG: PBS lyase HEAT-like repeat protein [Candidatus Scalindua rubra]|uniref:PBS lyase HEAT-like repeat protein n=1 Tax=Candidatus Scalindua rubra TaxID=1872076 RepID=A0A1E3XB36_9BACT|nr:MAG: PBS lyase HEAT-like repeat protein [Candidatus Scalindua rubra]
MANRRSLKTDISFLEKISIGAIGTKKVFDDLKRLGYYPIELERGSMSFKIWKGIKIKRLRVPDLLCIKCGKRVESRAKTKLQISMSHSFASPDRGWDFGLNDDDFIALVSCEKIGEGPIDWKASDLVQYIQVKHLREAFKAKKVFMERPKGVEEGFETRVTWPCAVASSGGEIDEINKNRIKFRRNKDGRVISLSLAKKGIKLKPIVAEQESIKENQIIASVVPISNKFVCPKDKRVRDYIKLINSVSLSDRYAAAKALSHFEAGDVVDTLLEKMGDSKDHIYIRLEAAASVLKLGSTESLKFFKDVLNDEYLENRLEGVIILGEIRNKHSSKLLIQTLLDKEQNSEIRAGAAWALGELKSKETLEALVSVFDDINLDIRAESARSLFRLAELYGSDIIKYFPKGSEDARAGISWALSKSGNFFGEGSSCRDE